MYPPMLKTGASIQDIGALTILLRLNYNIDSILHV
jgi:hypothetical protein